MNWLDIVILVALVVPAFFGLKQGIIKAAISLAGVIVGAVLASNFSEELGGMLTFVSNPDVANIAGYVIILVVVMAIAAVLAKIIKFTVKMVMLGWVDRLGGAVFGFLIGAVFMGALLAVIVNFSDGVGDAISAVTDAVPDVISDPLLDAADDITSAIAPTAEGAGPQFIQDSMLAGILLDKFPIVLALLPSEFDAVRGFFE
jgi:membrane protein required for colicin V production